MSDAAPYRYALTRAIDPVLNGQGTVAFVMLNPSTADEVVDDPTIRRCIGFASSWGYARLEVVNLYARRATDPRWLWAARAAGADIVGPMNDGAILRAMQSSTGRRSVVAAWGADKYIDPHRVQRVRDIAFACDRELVCVGITKDGSPRHPLYAKRCDPIVFPETRAARLPRTTKEDV